MTLITAQLLMACGGSPSGAALYAGPLAAACLARGVTTTARTTPLLANILNESSALTYVQEDLTYRSATWLQQVYRSHFPTVAAAQPFVNNPNALAAKVYGTQNGVDLRGRGLAQLTGLANYQAYGAAVGKSVAEVASYLTTPEGAADSAVWFYVQRGCLPLADRGDLLGVTKLWEGAGAIGWTSVLKWNGQIMRALGGSSAASLHAGAGVAKAAAPLSPTTEDLNAASLAGTYQPPEGDAS